MVSMNIAIKKEAYDFLRERKGEGQSFSDVILSFRKENDIMRFFGKLKDVDWDAREKEMQDLRDDIEGRC